MELIDKVALRISDLKQMEKNHRVDLDHKDCGELAELLEELSTFLR